MAREQRKNRYTPIEVAKKLGIPLRKFHQLVSEGELPKGRIGDDGRRYYTDKDLEFILREWKSKTTGKFLMYILPLIIVGILFVLIVGKEIKQYVDESRSQATPTPVRGFAAPPPKLWAPGTPWPTHPPPTPPPYKSYDYYRKYKRKRTYQREEFRRPPSQLVE